MGFTWALYESSLMRALQDLLTATLVLPGFAQVLTLFDVLISWVV